jgi:hypothetical protein
MDAHTARAIRYGILTSMLRIRQQLMFPGEWDDPAIPPLDSIHAGIAAAGYASGEITARAAHEHTIRWCLRRQEARA